LWRRLNLDEYKKGRAGEKTKDEYKKKNHNAPSGKSKLSQIRRHSPRYPVVFKSIKVKKDKEKPDIVSDKGH
jgi:hypothetical protein